MMPLLPKIGDVLPALAVEGFTQRQIAAYTEAANDRNPIHTDATAAHAIGLLDCPVQGMAIVARLENFICRWRSDAWLATTATRFVSPLLANQPMTVSGRVVAHSAADALAVMVRIFVQSDGGRRIVCVSDAQVRLTGEA